MLRILRIRSHLLRALAAKTKPERPLTALQRALASASTHSAPAFVLQHGWLHHSHGR